MKKNYYLAWLVLLFGIVAAASLVQYVRTPDEGGTPRIRIIPESHDFGDIPREIVEKTFTIKNTGESVLEITSVSTSCGCTTAEVSSERISPGGAAKLHVEMDPNVMGNITGKVKRIIYVQSNDPAHEEAEVYITANILGVVK